MQNILAGPSSSFIHNYHEHDSLLANIEEESLPPEACETAWREFLQERERENPYTNVGSHVTKTCDPNMRPVDIRQMGFPEYVTTMSETQIIPKHIYANAYLQRETNPVVEVNKYVN